MPPPKCKRQKVQCGLCNSVFDSDYNNSHNKQKHADKISAHIHVPFCTTGAPKNPFEPDVGRAKIPLCRLPPLCFTYGCPSGESYGSVKEALFNWYRSKDNKKVKDDIPAPLVQDSKFQYERIKLNKVPDITFGDKSGIPEDIKPIMHYGYQHMMIEKMKQKEAIRRQKIREREERIASRRRVILRVNPKDTVPEEPQTLWKMKKFSNVKAKVSTWRDKD